MEYSILKEGPEYLSIKKLFITREQLKSPNVGFQVYLWVVDDPIGCCMQSLEDEIEAYVKNLFLKRELVCDGFKITAEQCKDGWVLTYYLAAPTLYSHKITEEEFNKYI